MTLPTHQARTSEPARSDLVKRAADLCRVRPALFAEMVRLSDAWERRGVDRHRALEAALDRVGA